MSTSISITVTISIPLPCCVAEILLLRPVSSLDRHFHFHFTFVVLSIRTAVFDVERVAAVLLWFDAEREGAVAVVEQLAEGHLVGADAVRRQLTCKATTPTHRVSFPISEFAEDDWAQRRLWRKRERGWVCVVYPVRTCACR